MKLAALDIGSNSIHMIVADAAAQDRAFQVIDREKDMVKLGGGCFQGGRLTETAMSAALKSLRKCAKLIERHGCEEVVATATSAVREAKNGGDFLDAVERETGIRVSVISGEEEARLIWLAVRSAVDLAARRALIVDIGGGSVEAIVGDAKGILLARALKLGVLRVRDEFGGRGALSKRDRRRLAERVEKLAGPTIEEARAADCKLCVGTSGTILQLAALARARSGNPLPEQVSNERVALAAIEDIVDWLCGMSEDERARVPGLDPHRADTIHLGGVVLVEILRLAKARDLVLCARALREGLILDYLERSSARVRDATTILDIRRRSLFELVRRCETSGRLFPHARHVARLALALFDQLGPLHELGPVERQLLEFGALVHDVGEHIAFERHERHSQYLVENADLRGFSRNEVALLGLIARYHRGGAPKRRHPGFGDLPKWQRRALKRLVAILRVADGLDRSHFQVVRSVAASIEERQVVLAVEARDDAELEIFTAKRKGRLFERVFGRTLELRALGSGNGSIDAASAGGR
jgi:exopolyphosphatase/guanosine-5'-triphosphate,3'-diphosphate pyrophosphatase